MPAQEKTEFNELFADLKNDSREKLIAGLKNENRDIRSLTIEKLSLLLLQQEKWFHHCLRLDNWRLISQAQAKQGKHNLLLIQHSPTGSSPTKAIQAFVDNVLVDKMAWRQNIFPVQELT